VPPHEGMGGAEKQRFARPKGFQLRGQLTITTVWTAKLAASDKEALDEQERPDRDSLLGSKARWVRPLRASVFERQTTGASPREHKMLLDRLRQRMAGETQANDAPPLDIVEHTFGTLNAVPATSTSLSAD